MTVRRRDQTALVRKAGRPRSRGASQNLTRERGKIVQGLTNLLPNAAKFTPSSGKAWVRAFEQAGLAVVEVEDTGTGIPPAQADTIFERVRQVDDTLAIRREGAGLGLPISREIVHSHGGSLTVHSVPSPGGAVSG